MKCRFNAGQVKSSLKIEDVIQTYTGESLTGGRMCCPFHSEKTASFFVNAKKQYFKCFGCGEGGDVITFVMKYFSMDFKSAIEKLCNDFSLPEHSAPAEELIFQSEKRRREKAFDEWKNNTFTTLCRAYHAGREYLKEQNRGFFFERLTDDYLYIINHIDLLGFHIDLIIKNPVRYYNDYGEEGNDIAREIWRRTPSVSKADSSLRDGALAGCGGGENITDDVRYASYGRCMSYDYDGRGQLRCQTA